jgi:uncharacterized cupredoxin-like copper-binding protein
VSRTIWSVVVVTGLVLLGAAGFGIAAASSGSVPSGDRLGPGSASVRLGIEHSLFSTERIVVVEGTDLTFEVRNDDPIVHELIVGGPAVHQRHEEGHEAWHPPRDGEVTVAPGERGTTTFRFDEPGTVVFACHLPGHLAYGMRGEVVVEPAA